MQILAGCASTVQPASQPLDVAEAHAAVHSNLKDRQHLRRTYMVHPGTHVSGYHNQH